MRLTWVLSEETPTGLLDPNIIKDVAPSWGSWKTWKQYKTDNCVCSDLGEAKSLIEHAFHAVCNFYIMQSMYSRLGNPTGIKLFAGEFKSDTISNKDDLITLNLVASQSDIVLMSGFNFSPLIDQEDKIALKAREEYYYNVRELMQAHSTTQFVLIDYVHEMASWIRELDNVTVDTVDNVKNLLV